MSIVRRAARPLLAATFISSGVDAVLHPMNRAERARPLIERLGPSLHLPDDAELVVRGSGAVMAGAGVLLAVGRLPRLAATLLVVTAAPAACLDHPFWTQQEPERRRDQRRLFLEQLGLLGGLLLAAVDTSGRPGLAWRGRHAAQHAQAVGESVKQAVGQSVRQAVGQTAESVEHVERMVRPG